MIGGQCPRDAVAEGMADDCDRAPDQGLDRRRDIGGQVVIRDAVEGTRASSNPPGLWKNRSVARLHEMSAEVVEIGDTATSRRNEDHGLAPTPDDDPKSCGAGVYDLVALGAPLSQRLRCGGMPYGRDE